MRCGIGQQARFNGLVFCCPLIQLLVHCSVLIAALFSTLRCTKNSTNPSPTAIILPKGAKMWYGLSKPSNPSPTPPHIKLLRCKNNFMVYPWSNRGVPTSCVRAGYSNQLKKVF